MTLSHSSVLQSEPKILRLVVLKFLNINLSTKKYLNHGRYITLKDGHNSNIAKIVYFYAHFRSLNYNYQDNKFILLLSDIFVLTLILSS